MKNFKHILDASLTSACLALGAASAYAWDGVVSGKISQIHTVAATGNADTRVYLVGTPVMCANAAGIADGTWVFINSNNPNYKGMLSNLLTAYSLGKTVTLYSNRSLVSPANYCELAYMIMYDY